jgi:transposase
MYTIGCDQHKKYSFVVTKDENGNTVDQVKLYHTDKEIMKTYFSSLPQGSVVALESCGFDHWLGDMLEQLGMIVKLAHTAKTKAIAEERIKTDKISANVLADLLRTNLLPEAYRPPRHVRDSRQFMRYRLRLVRLRSSIKNSIHSILALHGIQQPFTDLFGTKGREFLKQLILPDLYSTIVNHYLSLVDDLSTRINQVDALLRRKLKSDPQAQLLNTIPGIGVITAHMILAEIGDIRRFKNAHKLARYIGIVPSLHQSGQILYQGRITKQGNKYLRTAFVESAQTAIRLDPYLKYFFEKIKAKKGYGVAIVAVAHKLVKVTYKVLSCRITYKYRMVGI